MFKPTITARKTAIIRIAVMGALGQIVASRRFSDGGALPQGRRRVVSRPMLLLRRLEPLTRPLLHARARMTRGMTLGVRGLVRDGEGRVLLVKHTYTSGWHMPGGGVERGETGEAALAREMVEEAGVELVGRPSLRSIHSSEAGFRGDHILFFEVGEWRAVTATSRGEIAAAEWFAPDALPRDVTGGTARRIAEALSGAMADPLW